MLESNRGSKEMRGIDSRAILCALPVRVQRHYRWKLLRRGGPCRQARSRDHSQHDKPAALFHPSSPNPQPPLFASFASFQRRPHRRSPVSPTFRSRDRRAYPQAVDWLRVKHALYGKICQDLVSTERKDDLSVARAADLSRAARADAIFFNAATSPSPRRPGLSCYTQLLSRRLIADWSLRDWEYTVCRGWNAPPNENAAYKIAGLGEWTRVATRPIPLRSIKVSSPSRGHRIKWWLRRRGKRQFQQGKWAWVFHRFCLGNFIPPGGIVCRTCVCERFG